MTVLKFFAWLFNVVGALLTLFSFGLGLCSISFSFDLGDVIAGLLLAGIPLVVGVGLIFFGVSILSKDDK